MLLGITPDFRSVGLVASLRAEAMMQVLRYRYELCLLLRKMSLESGGVATSKPGEMSGGFVLFLGT
jgi:hypothetical protein